MTCFACGCGGPTDTCTGSVSVKLIATNNCRRFHVDVGVLQTVVMLRGDGSPTDGRKACCTALRRFPCCPRLIAGVVAADGRYRRYL